MTSFCTVLKKGPKYGTEDVNRVFASLKQHTTKPFKFYCYTDYDTEFLDKDINIIPRTIAFVLGLLFLSIGWINFLLRHL